MVISDQKKSILIIGWDLWQIMPAIIVGWNNAAGPLWSFDAVWWNTALIWIFLVALTILCYYIYEPAWSRKIRPKIIKKQFWQNVWLKENKI